MTELKEFETKDEIFWYEAPLPHRIHRCRAWTTHWLMNMSRIQRCACGAIRINMGTWQEKNSRRRFRRGRNR